MKRNNLKVRLGQTAYCTIPLTLEYSLIQCLVMERMDYLNIMIKDRLMSTVHVE